MLERVRSEGGREVERAASVVERRRVRPRPVNGERPSCDGRGSARAPRRHLPAGRQRGSGELLGQVELWTEREIVWRDDLRPVVLPPLKSVSTWVCAAAVAAPAHATAMIMATRAMIDLLINRVWLTAESSSLSFRAEVRCLLRFL